MKPRLRYSIKVPNYNRAIFILLIFVKCIISNGEESYIQRGTVSRGRSIETSSKDIFLEMDEKSRRKEFNANSKISEVNPSLSDGRRRQEGGGTEIRKKGNESVETGRLDAETPSVDLKTITIGPSETQVFTNVSTPLPLMQTITSSVSSEQNYTISKLHRGEYDAATVATNTPTDTDRREHVASTLAAPDGTTTPLIPINIYTMQHLSQRAKNVNINDPEVISSAEKEEISFFRNPLANNQNTSFTIDSSNHSVDASALQENVEHLKPTPETDAVSSTTEHSKNTTAMTFNSSSRMYETEFRDQMSSNDTSETPVNTLVYSTSENNQAEGNKVISIVVHPTADSNREYPLPVLQSDSNSTSNSTLQLDLDSFLIPMALGSSVRKCCGPAQFFNISKQDCQNSEGPTNYRELLQDLVLEDNGGALVLLPGKLQLCPDTNIPPNIHDNVSQDTHLLNHGVLFEIQTGEYYHHSHYCLELAGFDSDSAKLVAAYCPRVMPDLIPSVIRKCCPVGYYFDSSLVECAPNTPFLKTFPDLVLDFSGELAVTTVIEDGILTCQQHAPEMITSSKAYLGEHDQLCLTTTGFCYPSSMYCIEQIWSHESEEPVSSAAYCPLNFFQKCCSTTQVMKDDTCIDSDVALSPYLTQLRATFNMRVGLPVSDDKTCLHIPQAVDDVRWWVANSGYLVIDVKHREVQTKKYCIDDFYEPSGEVITMAYICADELKDSLQLPLGVFDQGTVGKCCRPGYHLSPELRDCTFGRNFTSLVENPILQEANVTKVGFTGYPPCQSGQFHPYTFNKLVDHVRFGEDYKLHIVSMDRECVESETAVEYEYFCLDYGLDEDDPNSPVALVCVMEWENKILHTEKYDLTAALLGVSCCCLLVTLMSLISSRVRRGLVTVKRMNTLAGRILISYVFAHLVGFLSLALSMHVVVQENASACMVLSGVMQFFLLAGFHWNTSICLESLLLTMRVNASDNLRYLCHSVWSWGIPGVITTVTLTLDAHRDKLPCGVITARVGFLKCFFSDARAQLLYFYVPIALTLVANISLLVAARYARQAKLKSLAVGTTKKTRGRGLEASPAQQAAERRAGLHPTPSGGLSGLRTHQNKNVWSESVRLVLWSGGTWIFEVIGFVVAHYVSPHQEEWHDYLWYIPSSINSLRGLGIFVILVLTPENRGRLLKAVGSLSSIAGLEGLRSRRNKSVFPNGTVRSNRKRISVSVNHGSYSSQTSADKQRNMSITTTVTQLSSVRSPTTGDPPAAFLARSVSQMDRRPSTTSCVSTTSELEEVEAIELGGRRRSSTTPVSLPSVDEEDSCDDGSTHVDDDALTCSSA